ncbi:hypothetical protein [Hydrogenophaga sp.]|uniref:hypothetical protein n=1 Tax=Hydrogenophaga sp. TaxID=1904254 RepID=UPI002601DF48|nr:hypothetical protein [Hydrogenophaga sp.]MCW5652438.1 hypothetical protein [Hydrogenophaga sp.]
MRAYPLRLQDDLADAARAHADSLGISFNALVAVALDAYLHGEPGPVKPKPSKTKSRSSKPASKAEPVGGAPPGRWHKDPGNWRNFHEPDMWPWVDPRWKPPAGVAVPYSDPTVDPEDVTPEQIKAFEDAYWATHRRPVESFIDDADVPH